jgi:hypothetical protein
MNIKCHGKNSKYFTITICAILCILYFYLRYDFLERRFGKYFFLYAFFCTLTALAIFGWALGLNKIYNKIALAIFACIVGSMAGYTIMSIRIFLDRGYFAHVEFTEWLFVSTVSIFLMAQIWWVCLLFVGAILFKSLMERFCLAG